MIFLNQLLAWNKKINLTAITSEREIIDKHFLDSLAGLKAITGGSETTLLDIGSGAGFPGLPLKIVRPSMRVTLLEASQKKSAFLHHLCGALHLSEMTVLNQRVEDLWKSEKRYDWVVARAFAKPEIAIAKAVGLLSGNGRLVLYQGRPDPSGALPARSFWERTIPYQLPLSHNQRRLEIFRRPAKET